MRAVDLEEQTVEAIKAFTDTNRVLTKANKPKKIKEEENVNIAEDARGEGADKSYAEWKQAQKEKEDQNGEKGATFFTQATSSNVNATQLVDKNWMDGGAEYDSYITSYLCLYEYDRYVTTFNNETDRKGRERTDQSTYENQQQVVERTCSIHHEVNVPELTRRMWGDIYFNAKTRELVKKPPHRLKQKSFLEFILEPQYKLFAQAMGDVDNSLLMLCGQLEIGVTKDEMKLSIWSFLRLVCSSFLGNFNGFTSMCKEHIPSPAENAKQKVGGTCETERYENMVGCDQVGRLMVHTTKQYSTEDITCFHVPRKAMSGTLRAGRILSKAKNRGMELRLNNLGDAKETVLMVCADGSYSKLTKVDSWGGKFIAVGLGRGENVSQFMGKQKIAC